jgi:hypothetical protein
MIYHNENNWYSWSYGSGPLYGKQLSNDVLQTHFKPLNGKLLSFSEELERSAKSTLDYNPNLKPTILFSGGADSEVVLRTYLKIGANPKVCIIRYENDYNIYDVSYAITICSLLNVDYSIIDFNLKKFYENDAERISELAQIDRPRALPYCKFLEIVDGLPIMGEGDPYWVRLSDDYTITRQWRYRDLETFKGWYKYAIYLNKPTVAQFFKWSPNLVLSHSKLKWLQTLINDGYYGKLGTNSTKMIGYREVYPDMIERKKQTGFEKTDLLVNEFELFLKKKYNGLPYRQVVDRTLNNLWLEITGSNYQE